MNKLVIGRGHECDIHIDDSNDMVSRRHAIVTFKPFGRMHIYDLSSNGTYVNNIRVPKPDGCILHKNDKVTFGSQYVFDIGRLKNPYIKLYRWATIAAVVIILGGASGILYYQFGDKIKATFNQGEKKTDDYTVVEGGATVFPDANDPASVKVSADAVSPTEGDNTAAQPSPTDGNVDKSRSGSQATAKIKSKSANDKTNGCKPTHSSEDKVPTDEVMYEMHEKI